MSAFTRPATGFRRIPVIVTFIAALLSACAQVVQPMGVDSTAPVISRDEILIDAPLELVWKIQTDIAAWPQWRTTVPVARQDGPLQVGSVFHWEEGGLKIASTVKEFTPMRRIVWTGPAQGIFAVHVWEFTRTANGGVRVRTEESWAGEPVTAMAPKLQPMLDGALKDWLVRLKKRAEDAKVSNATR